MSQPSIGLRFIGNVTQCQTAVFAWQPLANPLLKLIDPLYVTFKLQRTEFSDFEPTSVYLNVRNTSQVSFEVDVDAGVFLYGQLIDHTGQFLQTPQPAIVQIGTTTSCVRQPFSPGPQSSGGLTVAVALGVLLVIALTLDIHLLRNAWFRRRRRRQEQRIIANSRVLEGMPRRPPSRGSTIDSRGRSLESPLTPDEAAAAVLMADTSADWADGSERARPVVPKIKTSSLQRSVPTTTITSPHGPTPTSTIQFSASPFARLRPHSVTSDVSERSDVATSYAATVAPSESLARYSSRSSRSSTSTDAAGFFAVMPPRDPFEVQ